jgi:DNA mismatch repair protein MutS
VDRGIIKIITPGTWMDETMDAKMSNYLASVYVTSWEICVVFCELSTGELQFKTLDRSLISLQKALMEQNVSEVVFPVSLDKRWKQALEEDENILVSYQRKSELSAEDEPLLGEYTSQTLRSAMGQLMGYLNDTQMQHIDHFMPVESMDAKEILVMDLETKNHLELVTTQSSGQRAQSLWGFMDRCQSAMGSRMLKRWIEMPLIHAGKIAKRQQAVAVLKNDFMLRDQLKEHLVYIYDMERLASRMAYGNASPRDVLQLVATLEHAGPILQLASALESYPGF